MCYKSIPKIFKVHSPSFYHPSSDENKVELPEKDVSTNEKYKILHREMKAFNKKTVSTFKPKK